MLEIASLVLLAFVRAQVERYAHRARRAQMLGQFYGEYFDRRLTKHREVFYEAGAPPISIQKDLN